MKKMRIGSACKATAGYMGKAARSSGRFAMRVVRSGFGAKQVKDAVVRAAKRVHTFATKEGSEGKRERLTMRELIAKSHRATIGRLIVALGRISHLIAALVIGTCIAFSLYALLATLATAFVLMYLTRPNEDRLNRTIHEENGEFKRIVAAMFQKEPDWTHTDYGIMRIAKSDEHTMLGFMQSWRRVEEGERRNFYCTVVDFMLMRKSPWPQPAVVVETAVVEPEVVAAAAPA